MTASLRADAAGSAGAPGGVFRCPSCESRVSLHGGDRADCPGCGADYPVFMGIPDLRTESSLAPYQENPAEWIRWDRDVASSLAEAYPRMGYEEFVRFSVARWGGHLPPDLKEHYIQFRLADRAKAESFAQGLRGPVQARFGRGAGDLAGIDIGCGSGAGVLALSRFCREVTGLDLRLADLLVARKLAEREGIPGVRLLCGVLESSPLPPRSFDIALARDVIEHTASPSAFLRRCLGLLSERGLMNFNSPNRYALRREPHVLLPLVGFFPRRLQRRYVRFCKGHPYANIRLLSLRELRALVGAVSPSGGEIVESGPGNARVRGLLLRCPPGLRARAARLFSDSFEAFLPAPPAPGAQARKGCDNP